MADLFPSAQPNSGEEVLLLVVLKYVLCLDFGSQPILDQAHL